jgi:hypothetical protein
MHPVVWGIACSNAKLESEDCIGEIWMEQDDHGAISFYGSTRASYTTQNHALDQQLFQAVYNEDLNVQAQAIAYAEEQMGVLVDTDNAWMYLLLGDPSMRIKRTAGLLVAAGLPGVFSPPESLETEIEVEVYDQVTGEPIPNAVFALWKPGVEGGPPEVFVNRYTDAGGQATLPVGPMTDGELRWSVTGLDGETAGGTIPVVSGASGVSGLSTSGLQLTVAPSVTRTGTTFRFGRPLRGTSEIRLVDVSGREIRRIGLRAGDVEARWDGRDSSGNQAASGIYFAVVQDGGRQHRARVVVVR